MQRDYEVMLVFSVTETVDEKKIKDYIKKQSTDEVTVATVKDMGKRKLAYPIRKQTEANYWFLDVSAASSAVPSFTKKLQGDETLLRFLVVKKED